MKSKYELLCLIGMVVMCFIMRPTNQKTESIEREVQQSENYNRNYNYHSFERNETINEDCNSSDVSSKKTL